MDAYKAMKIVSDHGQFIKSRTNLCHLKVVTALSNVQPANSDVMPTPCRDQCQTSNIVCAWLSGSSKNTWDGICDMDAGPEVY